MSLAAIIRDRAQAAALPLARARTLDPPAYFDPDYFAANGTGW